VNGPYGISSFALAQSPNGELLVWSGGNALQGRFLPKAGQLPAVSDGSTIATGTFAHVRAIFDGKSFQVAATQPDSTDMQGARVTLTATVGASGTSLPETVSPSARNLSGPGVASAEPGQVLVVYSRFIADAPFGANRVQGRLFRDSH
jgi:hypothetical protein